MDKKEIMEVVIALVISAVSFVISYFQFRQKGFLFNNAYIYASKKERNNMDTRPHYRQSGIVFTLVGILFLLNGIGIICKKDWMFSIALVIGVFTIIYAIVSSIMIGRKGK